MAGTSSQWMLQLVSALETLILLVLQMQRSGAHAQHPTGNKHQSVSQPLCNPIFSIYVRCYTEILNPQPQP
jgi:hypothetical protein